MEVKIKLKPYRCVISTHGQILIVAELLENSPSGFVASLFEEERLQEQKSAQSDLVVGQTSAIFTQQQLDLLKRLRVELHAEALELEVVQLAVAQNPIVVVIAESKDPCEAANCLWCELFLIRIVYRPCRIQYRFLGVVKDLRHRPNKVFYLIKG